MKENSGANLVYYAQHDIISFDIRDRNNMAVLSPTSSSSSTTTHYDKSYGEARRVQSSSGVPSADNTNNGSISNSTPQVLLDGLPVSGTNQPNQDFITTIEGNNGKPNIVTVSILDDNGDNKINIDLLDQQPPDIHGDSSQQSRTTNTNGGYPPNTTSVHTTPPPPHQHHHHPEDSTTAPSTLSTSVPSTLTTNLTAARFLERRSDNERSGSVSDSSAVSEHDRKKKLVKQKSYAEVVAAGAEQLRPLGVSRSACRPITLQFFICFGVFLHKEVACLCFELTIINVVYRSIFWYIL